MGNQAAPECATHSDAVCALVDKFQRFKGYDCPYCEIDRLKQSGATRKTDAEQRPADGSRHESTGDAGNHERGSPHRQAGGSGSSSSNGLTHAQRVGRVIGDIDCAMVEINPQHHVWRVLKEVQNELLSLKASLACETGDDIAALRDALELMYESWENGDACYEDPESCTGYIGRAFSLTMEDEQRILALIPKFPTERRTFSSFYCPDCACPHCAETRSRIPRLESAEKSEGNPT